MDNDYLQNIMSSPYVEEGALGSLKSKMSQALQKGSAMAGYGIENPYHTKIKLLWRSFEPKLLKILKDIKNNVEPILKHSSIKMNSKQENVLNQFLELYNTLNLKKYQEFQLGYMLREALGSIFTRDMELNKALASNNPDVILNAYKNKIESLYSKFIRDASKYTKLSPKFVEKETLKIYPQWIYKNIISGIKSIQKISPLGTKFPTKKLPISSIPTAVTPSSTSPITTPAAAPVSPSTSTSPTGVTTPIQKANVFGEPIPTPTQITPTATTSPSIPTAGTSGINTNSNDLAYLIDRVIDIIIDTVRSDVEHASPFIGPKQKEMPKSWEDPSLTKEEKGDKGTPSPDDEEEPEQIEGKFLYNFHSKWRKKHKFSIEVGKKTNITLPSGKNIELEVFWNNQDYQNNIYVRTKESGEAKSTLSLLFRFYDKDVNPRTEGGQRFDVNDILNKANPGKNYLSSGGIDPNILSSINSKKENLLRSLYATVVRKAMEFKAKSKGSLTLTSDNKGNVTIYDARGNPTDTLDINDVKKKIYSSKPEEADIWRKSLEHIDYFEKFPDMKPSVTSHSKFSTIVGTFKNLGDKDEEAKSYAEYVLNRMISSADLDPNKMSDEDLIKKALAYRKDIRPEKTGEEPTKVSGTASKPVTTEPTAPASSEKPEPEKAQRKSEPAKEERGGILWKNPNTGEQSLISKDKAIHYLDKGYYGFVNAMKAGGLYDKYKEMLDAKKKSEEKPPIKETHIKNGLINPWNYYNFLS